jgi:hypothetical protein
MGSGRPEDGNIIRNIKTSKLIPYERNPRRNDKAVDEVVKSIQRLGYKTPIIIDENFVILCGHTRFKAIKKLGWSEIPFVVQYSDLGEAKKNEYRIRDNKTAELAEWDFEILEEDFTVEDLQDMGFHIGNDENEVEFSLPDGEKEKYQQMVFLLSDEQAELVKNRIADVKQTEEYKYVETFGNVNSNGNALYLLVTKCLL